MPQSPLRDLLVGLFVLAGLGAVAYLSATLGGLSYGGRGGLALEAVFDEVGGLSPRAQVVVGGVKIGQVKGIRLDPDLRARVTLDVDPEVPLPRDTSASILTTGVLGDQYIALEPGAEEELLKDGDEIDYTQSAIVLERLIGRVVQNLGSSSE
jgi:phospholipid/cholesterol/gamma-HCH transport system substrate-binding protein